MVDSKARARSAKKSKDAAQTNRDLQDFEVQSGGKKSKEQEVKEDEAIVNQNVINIKHAKNVSQFNSRDIESESNLTGQTETTVINKHSTLKTIMARSMENYSAHKILKLNAEIRLQVKKEKPLST